jgi:chlorobactene glucosyltransferase
VPFAALPRLARKEPNLEDAAPWHDGPKVSVIVPARNEAAGIATVIRSVLATTYRSLELLVVDDRSADGTAELVEALARGPEAAGRLRLIRGVELPEGWYGKPWACHQGAEAATGEILVFTDADTWHAPELLPHAVGALLTVAPGLLTLAPFQRCDSFWERVVMPQFWMLLGFRFHPAAVSTARRAREVIANGQFIMMRRDTYQRLGGHAAVRAEVAEDLALAQRAFQHGERIHFAFAERLMETRMYTSLGAMVEGWSKNVYLGGRRSYPGQPLLQALVPLGLGLALGFWLVPPIGLLATLPHSPAWLALASGIGAFFWALVCVGMRIPPWYGLFYPLGAGVALFIVLRSTLRGRRRVVWRGRTYGEALNAQGDAASAPPSPPATPRGGPPR